MRFQVVALVMLGAAMVCGCIQADPGDTERVESAEQAWFAWGPAPHGFLSVTNHHLFIVPALPAPALDAAGLAFKNRATVDDSTDDDDDNGGGGSP